MTDTTRSKEKKYRRKFIGNHKLSPETQMMGYGFDPALSEGSLKAPVFLTSTFVFDKAEDGKNFFEIAYGKREQNPDEEVGLIYSRINNPDLEVLEDRLALWEDADKALSFSSGMAAISTCLWAYLRPGDVVLHSAPIYGGTEYLIRNILPQFGIKSVQFTSWNEEESLEAALKKAQALGPVAAIYAETPGNPTNCLIDLKACARAADQLSEQQNGRKPVVMVDNTFLGPVWQNPLEFGADIVIYSLTKYVGGHSDLVAGAAIGRADIMAPVAGFRTILGTMCDPHTGWLLMRSLETLKLRMTASAENARAVAAFLRDHPKIKDVGFLDYLPTDDPARIIFDEQCKSAGSTFAFTIHGGEAEAFKLLNSLQIIKLAVSLGGTESLMEHPYTMTHSDVPDTIKDSLGITEGMLRISVGVENKDDLIADLSQALAQL